MCRGRTGGPGLDGFDRNGTKRRIYLEENVTTAEIGLTAEDLTRLDAAAPRGAAGARKADMSSVDR